MRTVVRPQAQSPGKSRARSWVRKRISGRASFVTQVKTNSPCWSKGSGSKVSVSIISGMKWSSAMCIPNLWVHSMATAGPMTSDRP